MIATDTNIILASYLGTDVSVLVERIVEIDTNWIAPRLWRSEMRNALMLCVRRELLSLQDVMGVMARAEEFMEGGELDVESLAVLHLAHISGCTTYDCEFVALAQVNNVPLITLDKQILSRFPHTAFSPQDFLDRNTSRR